MLGFVLENNFKFQIVQRYVCQEYLLALLLILEPSQMQILLFCIEPFRKGS